ncbi:unnamed protein product [Caenorhabditis sp. 36 PRJEB53466]|nr:unnamed protein product [Caenorhabditis sp. 36 PRJEB53466]
MSISTKIMLTFTIIVGLQVQQVLSSSNFKMMITNGEPETYSGYSTLNLTWDECVDYCYDTTTCILVYEQVPSCLMFTIGQISSVRKAYASLVAYKISINSSSDSCPSDDTSGENSYIVDNSLSVSTYQAYSVSYSNSSWTFTSSQMLYCPQDFSLFVRDKGPWCMKVIETSTCVNQTDASNAAVSSYSGVLSGLDSEDEFYQALAESVVIWQTSSVYPAYGFWVNGVRTSACTSTTAKPVSKSATCNGTNEFTFTDPTLSSSPQGYVWFTNQPDGIKTTPTVSNCLYLRANNATPCGIDDVLCANPTYNGSTSICFKGYLCGLAPT